MLFQKENILIFHPGKCAGTTIEHLFLRRLTGIGLTDLFKQSCFNNKNNFDLSPECLKQRLQSMVGYLGKPYDTNGVHGIYLQHADIQATIDLHGKEFIDSFYKVTFVRSPFSRILSAFYYNALDRKWTFRDYVLTQIEKSRSSNRQYTVNHFGDLHRYTHYNNSRYVNFIGKVENIEIDVQKLSKAVSLPLDLSKEPNHAQTVARSHYAHYSEAYDESMVDKIYNLYSEDFKLYGYKFERVESFNPLDYMQSENSIHAQSKSKEIPVQPATSDPNRIPSVDPQSPIKAKSMKNIAILTGFYNADPAYSLNRSVQDQISMLVSHGYKPKVLVMASSIWNNPPENYGHEAVELIQLPSCSMSNEIQKDDKLDEDVSLLDKALTEALQDVDVVLTHDVIYQPAGLKLNIAGRHVAAELPNILWLHWVHSATSPYRLFDDGVISKQHIGLLEQKWPNSFIVFFNEISIPRIAENFGYEENEVKIVPHATDVSKFLGLSDEIDRLYTEKRFYEADYITIIPARLDRGKQVEWVIKIMARLKWQGQNVRIVVMDFHSTAGDKVTYRNELKQVSCDWGLDEVELTFISEFNQRFSSASPHHIVRELFSLSHLCITPSRSESYSYVAQEAAIMGNLLILNHDFPPFWDIYGKNALYFQFSSNIDKMTLKDGDTQTSYADIAFPDKPDNYPEAVLRKEKGQWLVNGDAVYADMIAHRIRYEFGNNITLGQRQDRLRFRNLFSVFQTYIEPLFYSKEDKSI